MPNLKKINSEVQQDVKEKKAEATNLTFANPTEQISTDAKAPSENEWVRSSFFQPSIFAHLNEKDEAAARLLLKRFNIHNYEGGTIKIDNYTYNYDQLFVIMHVLFAFRTLKRTTHLERLKLRKFCSSVERKKLTSLVKNKKYFTKIPWHEL